MLLPVPPEQQLRKLMPTMGVVIMKVAPAAEACANLEQEAIAGTTKPIIMPLAKAPNRDQPLSCLSYWQLLRRVIDTSDIIDTKRNCEVLYKTIRDTKEGGYGKISVKQFLKNPQCWNIQNHHRLLQEQSKEFVNRLYLR